ALVRGGRRSLFDVANNELVSVRIRERTPSLPPYGALDCGRFIDDGSASPPDLFACRFGVVMREYDPRNGSGLTATLPLPHDVHRQQRGRPGNGEGSSRGRGIEGGLFEA